MRQVSVSAGAPCLPAAEPVDRSPADAVGSRRAPLRPTEAIDKEKTMARIIVIPDTPRRPSIDAPVLMDEHVRPDHLADEHLSHQIIERMAWAVADAQDAPRVP